MIAHFDASALVKLLIDEQGSTIAATVWDACSLAGTSTISLAEVPAALAAAHRDNRLTPSDYRAAKASWSEYASELHIVELPQELVTRAGALAETHALSDMDAIHLASAVILAPDVTCTWDAQLHKTAQRVDLQVSPPGVDNPPVSTADGGQGPGVDRTS